MTPVPRVMISYSHDNKDFAARLSHALTERGLTVWYDRDLIPGDDFSIEIQQQIITSAAVLVVWSKASCTSKWVRAEADLASRHEKLLQVISEPCELPLPFGGLHYTDLSIWDGTLSATEIDKIVAAAAILTERRAAVRPTIKSPQPEEELAEVRRILDEEARIKVSEARATGEVSDVYLGRYGNALCRRQGDPRNRHVGCREGWAEEGG
jgi:hypothetical protein